MEEVNLTVSSNFTPDVFNSSSQPLPSNIAETVTCSLQATIIFAETSVCLVAFARTPALRTPFNYYLISILTGELILSMNDAFLAVQHYHGYWIFSKKVCTFMLFIYFYCNGVVANAHFLIGVNRTWALFFPHHFRRHNTKHVTISSCASVWISTAVLVLPWVILNEPLLDLNGPFYRCRVRMSRQHPFSTVIMLLFVSPALFIISSYPFLRKKQLNQQRIRNNLGTKSVFVVEATLGPTALPNGRKQNVSNSQDSTTTDPEENEDRLRDLALQRQQMEDERLKQKRQSNAFLVLTSIVICTAVFWSPIIVYGVGEVIFPQSLVFTDTSYFALVTWNTLSTCIDPLVFMYTVPLLRKQVRQFFTACFK